ncbi:GNAT family N-acetyltransferase [Gracilibacillus timonensis]|uniref:GNAT family N-acetyltransferase n=1 Tax=Gracilibacillus timonensis TaxID=1816696 RepID=UPI000826FB8B|nr:GNAT family protein [Gracilibacillus timonensis]
MIQLEYFEEKDFKDLMDWIPSAEFLLQWGGPQFVFPLTKDQLHDYIKHANLHDSETYIYKAKDSVTRKMIGHISLNKVDRKNRSARIANVLIGDKASRGKGMGKVMVNELLPIAFEEWKLHRVSLGVFDFNQSAIHCYEKVGFKKEGLLRECRKIGGEYWNLLEMSILEDEWKALSYK